MDLQIKYERAVLITGLITYSILGVLSVLYYRERTIILDMSFHLFYILKDGNFAIQVNRFGAIFTQLFPLIGSKLGLSLQQIMMVYSLGFIIYYASIFLICLRVFKNSNYALVMLLFSVFMVTDTFYWIQSELIQGTAFTILYFAFIEKYKKTEEMNAFALALMFLMLITIAFFHPILVFVFLFLTITHFLNTEISTQRKVLISGLIFYMLVFIFKNLLFRSGYDSDKMGQTNNIFKLFPNYLFLLSNKNFVRYLLSDYYLIPIALIAISIFYLKTKKFIKYIVVLFFFFFYLLLVNVSFPDNPLTFQFYMESLYLPLSLFLIVPLVFDFFPKIPTKFVWMILVVIIPVRIIHIATDHHKFTNRLNWERRLLAETERLDNKKLMIHENDVPMDTLLMTWGSSYEFWLLSSLEKNTSRSIIIDEYPERWNTELENNKVFFAEWGIFNYSELPSKYFIFQDTSKYIFYKPQ